MSTAPTPRDYAHTAALMALYESEDDRVTASDVVEINPDLARMTRLRTMWSMRDLGWLEHQKYDDFWYAGEKWHRITNEAAESAGSVTNRGENHD